MRWKSHNKPLCLRLDNSFFKYSIILFACICIPAVCVVSFTIRFLHLHTLTSKQQMHKSEISITQCPFLEYLHSILKNHTAHACEGDTLIIQCPSRTSVTVLSAFYGRRVPNQHLCPSANSNITVEEDTECASPIAVEVYEATVCFTFTYLECFHDSNSNTCFLTVAESAFRVSGSAVLSHSCLQPCVWARPLSSHQQVPVSLLQVQTRYAANVLYISYVDCYKN